LKNQGFYIDTSDLQAYVKYLQTLSYNDMIRDSAAVVRQSAQDMRRAYMPLVPESKRKGETRRYKFTKGNLRRSVGVYKKIQRSTFVVEFSVGFKLHRYGDLSKKIRRGGRANDGYYGTWVNSGVAGRQKGKAKEPYSSMGFRDRAEIAVNRVYEKGLSTRGSRVIERKLKKIAERKK
jgi:hypothetical protein